MVELGSRYREIIRCGWLFSRGRWAEVDPKCGCAWCTAEELERALIRTIVTNPEEELRK
jgi:hypothetical protein